MWALLWLVACLLVVLAVVLWPEPETVWRIECTGCGWGGDLSGCDPVTRAGAAALLAAGHEDGAEHIVRLTEEKGR